MIESHLMDSGFAVPVFSPGDDPVACLNKAMAFLTVVASSMFPSTNNQLKNSSNPRNQATIQDGRPKRPRNASWYKEKSMLAEAQEAGQILDEEQLAFLVDPGVLDGQAVQTIIPNNAAFQTEDLDTYDSDYDDVPHFETYLNVMENQSVHEMQDFEQTPTVEFTDNEIHSDSNIIPYSQYLHETQQSNEKDNKEHNNESVTTELERYKERVKIFEQRLNIDLSSREKMIDSQMDDMIKEKLALKEQVDSLELFFLFKSSKECLLQTFNVFKSESKEKEDKYMENEIYLEKKIKELDNILFKVGQSAQTVHMLTKPQAFYDNIHKRALGYQNPFHLKKGQRIKPTLFDNVVKIKTTPDARTEGEWGFKHTKVVFNIEIIPFLKSLKDIFNVFDKDLLNEIMEVQTVFNQMDAAIQQSLVDKQCLEIAKKELLLENDRLLQQIMSQYVLLTVMNFMSLIGESMNMDKKRNEPCDKCFNLDAELLK
ncbi:hypothetical protein Tco_0671624 [Tanacetum coccineum]